MDAFSEGERNKVNENYTNTLLSRLACDGFEMDGKKYLKTPQVIIMQRLQDMDLCGHLFRGGGGSKFVWLNIPGIITKDVGSKDWYDRQIVKHGYTHAVPYLYDLKRTEERSSFWAVRKSLKSLDELAIADPYNFGAQYMGDPISKGMGIVQEDWFQTFDPRELDKSTIARTFMTADTASTTKDYSDYTVVCYWGVTRNNELLLLDVTLGKWETPEVMSRIKAFWKKHKRLDVKNPRMTPRGFYLEDKSEQKLDL